MLRLGCQFPVTRITFWASNTASNMASNVASNTLKSEARLEGLLDRDQGYDRIHLVTELTYKRYHAWALTSLVPVVSLPSEHQVESGLV